MDAATTATLVPAVSGGGSPAHAEQPVLTYYDDATGERTELTPTGLTAWAARTARLLHEGCGLGTGHRAAVLLPPHWQTAAVLLGAWAAGLSVSFRPRATAGLPERGPGAGAPIDAVFAARDRVDDWLEDVPEAPHRFALGPDGPRPAEVPADYRDFLAELRRFPEHLPAYAPIRFTDAATVDGTTYRQWGDTARAVAEKQDLQLGDRLLVDAAAHEHPVFWLLAPLSAGASIVLCANLDPAKVDDRIAAEGITRAVQ
jgi:uncharacterized protein (TIGR03089 family)